MSVLCSEVDVDRILKDRWLRNFKEDINDNKEKQEKERYRKMIEEKEYLFRVQQKVNDDRLKHKYKKQHDTNDRLHEYQIYLEKRKRDEEEKLKEKAKEKELVTLDFKSDEHLKNFKEYMIRLNDNVESNIQKHKQFLKEKKPESPNRLSNIHNSVYNHLPYSNGVYNPLIEAKPPRSPLPHDGQLQYYNSGISNKSDVTYVDYFSKNLNQEYFDYRNAQKEFLKYNRDVVDNREKKKQIEFDDKRKDREVSLKEIEKSSQCEEAYHNYQLGQQKLYRDFLDNQMKQNNSSRRVHLKSDSNRMVQQQSVNPYSPKKVDLGESTILHNPILNPVTNYKHNRYIYGNNSLKLAGSRVIY